MVTAWRHGAIAPRTVAALAVLEAALIVFVLGACQYARTIPPPTLGITLSPSVTVPGNADLPWPSEGQAAIAIRGMGVIGAQPVVAQPQPIASTTKIMTALVLLDDHPLAPTDRGPTIPITEAHATAFMDAILNDESALEVRGGRDLSQRELLDGLLVASANNFARILAEWDAGSADAFVAKMNQRAAQLGMLNTRFVEPSGLAAGNVSTAGDLLILADAAMANPTFAAIVAQKEVSIPVAGKVPATNALLGKGGVVGIKTGETDEAGACLVFAAERPASGGTLTIFGAVLGQGERSVVFDVSENLARAALGAVVDFNVVEEGTEVGRITTRWDASAGIVTSGPIAVTAWPGQDFALAVEAREVAAPIHAGDVVGELIARRGGTIVGRVPLIAGGDVEGPGAPWRMLRD